MRYKTFKTILTDASYSTSTISISKFEQCQDMLRRVSYAMDLALYPRLVQLNKEESKGGQGESTSKDFEVLVKDIERYRKEAIADLEKALRLLKAK